VCPDPALLAAYLDGTLFSRDASAVDHHTSTCARCAGILAAMRADRAAVQSSKWLSPWTIGGVVTAVTIVAIGTWVVLRGATNPDVAPPSAPTA